MFMDVREVLGPNPKGDAAGEPAGAALHRLNAMHKGISGAVGKEASAMARIFSEPAAALAAFVTRIFEQRLKVGLYQLTQGDACSKSQGSARWTSGRTGSWAPQFVNTVQFVNKQFVDKQ